MTEREKKGPRVSPPAPAEEHKVRGDSPSHWFFRLLNHPLFLTLVPIVFGSWLLWFLQLNVSDHRELLQKQLAIQDAIFEYEGNALGILVWADFLDASVRSKEARGYLRDLDKEQQSRLVQQIQARDRIVAQLTIFFKTQEPHDNFQSVARAFNNAQGLIEIARQQGKPFPNLAEANKEIALRTCETLVSMGKEMPLLPRRVRECRAIRIEQ